MLVQVAITSFNYVDIKLCGFKPYCFSFGENACIPNSIKKFSPEN